MPSLGIPDGIRDRTTSRPPIPPNPTSVHCPIWAPVRRSWSAILSSLPPVGEALGDRQPGRRPLQSDPPVLATRHGTTLTMAVRARPADDLAAHNCPLPCLLK